MSHVPEPLSAEDRFRAAFKRLREGVPQLLSQGTPVSQNNVAKEAGRDPSALKKDRFPTLISEIQAYVDIHTAKDQSDRQKRLAGRNSRREVSDRLEQVTLQRDEAQSQLLSAHDLIVQLKDELALLKERLEEAKTASTKLNKTCGQ